MSNLLDETQGVIANNDKDVSDVQWVGSSDGELAITWDEFAAIANVDYESVYGAAKVAQDLVVVGSGWWLERHEYDGSEWWEFKEIIKKSDNAKSFNRVTIRKDQVGWKDLAEVQS